MRNLCAMCFLVALITGSIAQGASYQKIDGTIVDPILGYNNNPHPYSGNNLAPSVNLGGHCSNFPCQWVHLNNAHLSHADLSNATLDFTTLNYADLRNAKLISSRLEFTEFAFADLTNADLSDAWMYHARLNNANLTGVNLTDVQHLATSFGAPFYSPTTLLPLNFDPVAKGWILIPEPSTIVLFFAGAVSLLVRLGRRKR